jgi:tRNA (guanine-N7-)-methyltransferase
MRNESADINEFSEIVIPAELRGGDKKRHVSISDGCYKNDSRISLHADLCRFENDNSLEVDIGAGKGRFLLARALEHPELNFFGIERQNGRLYRMAKKIRRHALTNVKLARVEASAGIELMLEPESVSTFYILFPDPWPKKRHYRRRLINTAFMDLLHSKLCSGGVIHYASDHQNYAAYVQEIFAADKRFEAIDPFIPTEAERTDFEIIFAAQEKPTSRLSVKKK